jgi:hypothetical protein
VAAMAKFQRLGQICGSCSNARTVHWVASPNLHGQVHGAFLHSVDGNACILQLTLNLSCFDLENLDSVVMTMWAKGN